MVFLTCLVKHEEMETSQSYKKISEQRKEKDQLVICPSAFSKQKCTNLNNVSLTFFKFQSIFPTLSVAKSTNSTVLLH